MKVGCKIGKKKLVGEEEMSGNPVSQDSSHKGDEFWSQRRIITRQTQDSLARNMTDGKWV